MKTLFTALRAKAATLGATAVIASSGAMAQTASETAVNDAIESGTSLVTIAVGGVIGIAAIVMGTFIVLRLIGR